MLKGKSQRLQALKTAGASRFILSQVVVVLYMTKLGVLALFDFATGTGGLATIGRYATGLGLVNAFALGASLKARVLGLTDQGGDDESAFVAMRHLIVIASLPAILLSFGALAGTEYVAVGLLIACTRLTENFFDAELSRVQKFEELGVARSLRLQLERHGLIAVCYLTIFVTGSLEMVLLLEIGVGLAWSRSFWSGFWVRIARPLYSQVARGAALLSLVALLNGLNRVVVLRILAERIPSELVLVSLVYASLALTGRLASSFGLYFQEHVIDLIGRFGRTVIILPGCLLVSAVPLATTNVASGWVVVAALIVLTNSGSLLIRQSLLLGGRASELVREHVVDFVCVAASAALAIGRVDTLAIILWSQVFRVLLLLFVWRRADLECQPVLVPV